MHISNCCYRLDKVYLTRAELQCRGKRVKKEHLYVYILAQFHTMFVWFSEMTVHIFDYSQAQIEYRSRSWELTQFVCDVTRRSSPFCHSTTTSENWTSGRKKAILYPRASLNWPWLFLCIVCVCRRVPVSGLVGPGWRCSGVNLYLDPTRGIADTQLVYPTNRWGVNLDLDPARGIADTQLVYPTNR